MVTKSSWVSGLAPTLTLLVLGFCTFCVGQEARNPPEPPIVQGEGEIPPAKKHAASVAVILLGLVSVLGVGMIGVALIIGARSRRLARESLSHVSPPDPYWFLKEKRAGSDVENDPTNQTPPDELNPIK